MEADARAPREPAGDRQRFALNALLGAVVTVLLSFLPFSPILGGGVAGYLQRGPYDDGAIVGALSGFVAALPVFLVLALVFGGLSLGALGVSEPAGALLFGGLFWISAAVVAVLAVGQGAIGGVLGNYLARTREAPDSAEP